MNGRARSRMSPHYTTNRCRFARIFVKPACRPFSPGLIEGMVLAHPEQKKPAGAYLPRPARILQLVGGAAPSRRAWYQPAAPLNAVQTSMKSQCQLVPDGAQAEGRRLRNHQAISIVWIVAPWRAARAEEPHCVQAAEPFAVFVVRSLLAAAAPLTVVVGVGRRRSRVVDRERLREQGHLIQGFASSFHETLPLLVP